MLEYFWSLRAWVVYMIWESLFSLYLHCAQTRCICQKQYISWQWYVMTIVHYDMDTFMTRGHYDMVTFGQGYIMARIRYDKGTLWQVFIMTRVHKYMKYFMTGFIGP